MTHPWGKALDLACPDMKGKMYRCLLTQERHREGKEGDEKQDPIWGETILNRSWPCSSFFGNAMRHVGS